MRQLFFIPFFACSVFFDALGLVAQAQPAKMGSTTKTSSEIEGMKMLEKSKSTAPAPKATLPAPVKPPPVVPQHADYLHPGILVNVNGVWEGSDHLLNLSNQIGVYIQILKPEEETLEVNVNDLQKQVETIFGDANIKPLTLAAVGKPPLPAFEIEIFVYPIDRGYAAFVEGRLLESVILERFKMDANMAFQAITWEKQSLIVSPKDKFKEQLEKATQDIADAFVTRFQAYERIKRGSTY